MRPGNREVTHHTVVFSSGGAADATAGGLFDVLVVWAVGTPPTVYPEGMGRWVRKGQTLRTNLHYHPNGTAQTDRTKIGLYFGKGEMKKEVVAALAGNLTFAIPPNSQGHEVRGAYVVDQDIDVVSIFPHMHLRGSDMTMTATYPDGRREPLLSVPTYDFNWQLFYYPKTRLRLPRGTRIDLVAHYDNSSANRFNPDPSRMVTFGEGSNDEMMFGMFEFTVADGVSPNRTSTRDRMTVLASTLAGGSAQVVDMPFGRQATTVALDLRRSGEAQMYLPSIAGTITPVPLQDLQWNGDAFQFRVPVATMGLGGVSGALYAVSGTVGADGSISGTVTRAGNAQAPAQPFNSARGR